MTFVNLVANYEGELYLTVYLLVNKVNFILEFNHCYQSFQIANINKGRGTIFIANLYMNQSLIPPL